MLSHLCCNDSVDLIAFLATGKHMAIGDTFIQMRAGQAFPWEMSLYLIRIMRNSHMFSRMASLSALWFA